MTNLQLLFLSENDLTGPVPSELGDLPTLRGLWLGGNRLTGCLPPALHDADHSDLDSLGLEDCQ